MCQAVNNYTCHYYCLAAAQVWSAKIKITESKHMVLVNCVDWKFFVGCIYVHWGVIFDEG